MAASGWMCGLRGEAVWLTQQLMAELFETTQQSVSLHLQNIHEEGELAREATHKEILWVRREGAREVRRRVVGYNLDAIIPVGYRVKSRTATQFRIWATQRLREYIQKSFVLDDERLRNPHLPFDYFEELMRRIPVRMADWIKKLDSFLTATSSPTPDVSRMNWLSSMPGGSMTTFTSKD